MNLLFIALKLHLPLDKVQLLIQTKCLENYENLNAKSLTFILQKKILFTLHDGVSCFCALIGILGPKVSSPFQVFSQQASWKANQSFWGSLRQEMIKNVQSQDCRNHPR